MEWPVVYALCLFFFVLGTYYPNQNRNQSTSSKTSSSTVQPLLNYMHENKLDLRWTKLSLSGIHYNRDEPRSCHLSPNPFVEVSRVRVSTSYENSIASWNPSYCAKLVMRMKIQTTVMMEGEYEVHAGYYRSTSRSFNLTLVGLEQEIAADMYCLDGWKISKVGMTTKLENILFHYDALDKFAFKLPQVEGQCWNFHVGDLRRNMTPSEWEVVGSNMVGSLNAALPRGATYVW